MSYNVPKLQKVFVVAYGTHFRYKVENDSLFSMNTKTYVTNNSMLKYE